MLMPGLKVKVHYTGTLDDGTVFDSSYDRGEPLEFTIGERKMLFAFEQTVAHMAEGATTTIHLTPDEAYGPRYDDQVDQVPIASFGSKTPPVGQLIQMRIKGRMIRANVVSVDGDSVTLDYNHPLAGQNVNFQITLVEVEHKTALEQEKLVQPCSCHRVADSLSHAHHDHACDCA